MFLFSLFPTRLNLYIGELLSMLITFNAHIEKGKQIGIDNVT